MLNTKQAINLTSLDLIQEQLMTTIDDASTHLETFISERDNSRALEDCIASLQQIRGSLDVIQLYGACELAGEILAAAIVIQNQQVTKIEEKLSALTKGFFVLSCYFEYAQQYQTGMPVLLIPYINEIRLSNNKPVMPESYFETADTRYRYPSVSSSQTFSDDELKNMSRRFRHMYQVGLLSIFQDKNIKLSLTFMLRAVAKVYRLSQGSESETYWLLASYCLQAFADTEMEMSVTRRWALRQIDQQLKLISQNGTNAFQTTINEEFLKELAYFCVISGIDSPEFISVKANYGFESLSYTENQLQQETVSLTGPSANTVQSVAEVLKIELNIAKENIEKAQTTDDTSEVYTDTISRIEKVKEILNIVGLTSAATTLSEPLENLQVAYDSNKKLDTDGHLAVADVFLYIESVLGSLYKRSFSGEKLDEMNKLTQSEIISKNNLHSAQLVVLQEAEGQLATIKNALTAYTDSDYDKIHLEDLMARFNEVRGGMVVLSLPRAAQIVSSCALFVEKSLMSMDETAAIERMLETFADALICLEYYLDCLKVDKNVSPETLVIAEESLKALGFKVNA